MLTKKWLWNTSCPCGYRSAKHSQEWLARLKTYLHALFSGHCRGDMTVGVCKIQSQKKISDWPSFAYPCTCGIVEDDADCPVHSQDKE